MDYDEFVDTTQDNTQVQRIMSDFQSFLYRQSKSSCNASAQNYLEEADRNSTMKSSGMSFHDENVSFNIDVKVKLNRLEKQHSSEKQALTVSNIALESECAKLNSQLKILQERCDTLELKNKQLTETNLDLIDKVQDAEETRDTQISKWKANYEKLENLKEESDKRILFELSNYETKCTEMQEQNMNLQVEVNNLSLQLEEALSIGDLYNKKISDSAVLAQQHHQTLSELASAKLQIHSLTTRLSDVEDIEKNVQCFKEDMQRLQLMEAEYKRLYQENLKLKENQDNVALLNEKLFSLEQKLSRSQEKCDKADELEVINQSLQQRLVDIDERNKDEIALKQLQAEVSNLQNHSQFLIHTNETLRNDYLTLQKKFSDEKQNELQLNEKVEDLSESCTSLKAQLQRLKKRAALLSHERDSLRDILQSYDAELTMTSHSTQLKKQLTNAEEANRKLHIRIEHLEAELQKSAEESIRQRLLAKHGAFPAKIKEEESFTSPMISNEEFTKLQNEVDDLKKSKHDLETEKESLLEKIEELEVKGEGNILKGGYDPCSEKVLHFTMNPADSARQKFKQDFANLKQENLRLKKKLKELEEGRDVSVSEIEVPENVRNELARSELRIKRLKEVFNRKIQEFRQACYCLTGYRIDSSSDLKFKLVSMYAESESDCILFQMESDGSMHLLETEFSKTLQELISLHLHHQNSIPMFLSAVSVSLFSQQTMLSE